MLNKKITSVLAVTLMLTMGIGFVFVGNDQSEGTWGGPQTPVASLTMDAYQLWQAYDGGNGTDTYWVGYGTYVSINHYAPSADSDVLVVEIATDYGSGGTDDTAGLTLNTSLSSLYGRIDKGNNGVIEITIEYRYDGGSDNIQIYLAVIDVTSTQNNPWTVLNLPANVFVEWGSAGLSGNIFYVEVGSSVTITQASMTIAGTYDEYGINDVTSGFGLSIPTGTGNLTGTLTQTGTITVGAYETDNVDIEELDITIEVVDSSHADVRMIGGETWTYTPTTNMTSVLSISGTATSWVSLTSGTVSGTAPTNTSVGQTYDLTITASTSDPNQNVTQTVTFTVDPPITLTVPKDPWIFQSGSGSADVASSNFEDGTRAIYSISGTSGYSINAATGVLSSSDVTDGFVTVTVSSPYTYTSGATNSTSAALSLKVQGDDVIPEMVLNLYVDENSSDQTYDVTWGTYLNLSWDENITGGTTISGLNAGLSVSGNTIRDYMVHTSGPMSGTITISIGSPDTIRIVLNVLDMSTTSSTYLSELNVPINFGMSGYGTIYVAVGSPVTITPVTINGTTYGVDFVTSGYGLSIQDGVLSGTITQEGTITVAADDSDFSIIAVQPVPVVQLTASVSGTLYLVTGKTVPNTPAEAVALNHNDVGVGTYTWAVVGTNNSGVTVASDGTLGGTPGNIGTYAVTVRCTSVVDGETQTADATLNIVIVQVLAFTSSPSSGTIR